MENIGETNDKPLNGDTTGRLTNKYKKMNENGKKRKR